ncbi:MAG: hypothetical protein ACFE75_00925 [Candidatus Hodarchaeota archaeon]
MYFHNVVYIQCPYCRYPIEVVSKSISCYICGGPTNFLETDDPKQRII